MAGILIERVTGAPFAEVLSKRVFEPLGMADTGFYVASDKLARFTTMYAPAEAAAVVGGGRGPAGDGLTQRMMTSPEPPAVAKDFWSAAYAALA